MKEVTKGIVRIPTSFVNAYLVDVADGGWVLIDTGLHGFKRRIRVAAEMRYGKGARPNAIVLTHGHFDHIGTVKDLAEEWDVPVYAHRMEAPYLRNESSYPPFDPTTEGFMAKFSRFMPTHGIDLGDRLHELTGADEIGARGMIPGMPGWEWMFTPGHSPGHIVLFRESDRTLIGGDALATVNYDSFIGTLTKRKEIWRAGTYATINWDQTEQSVKEIAALLPRVLACGHGIPMKGHAATRKMEAFAGNYPRPGHGRYVREPARVNERGVVALPPAPADPLPKIALTAAIVGIGLLLYRRNLTS